MLHKNRKSERKTRDHTLTWVTHTHEVTREKKSHIHTPRLHRQTQSHKGKSLTHLGLCVSLSYIHKHTHTVTRDKEEVCRHTALSFFLTPVSPD